MYYEVTGEFERLEDAHEEIQWAFSHLAFDEIVGLDAVDDGGAIRVLAKDILAKHGLAADKVWQQKVTSRFMNRQLGDPMPFYWRNQLAFSAGKWVKVPAEELELPF